MRVFCLSTKIKRVIVLETMWCTSREDLRAALKEDLDFDCVWFEDEPEPLQAAAAISKELQQQPFSIN